MNCTLKFNKNDILNLISTVYGIDTSKASISYYPGNHMEPEELTIAIEYPIEDIHYSPEVIDRARTNCPCRDCGQDSATCCGCDKYTEWISSSTAL